MKLVIFERDWADEFSPFGFALMEEEEFREFRDYYSKGREWFFGTNEGFEKDEIMFQACKVKDVTKEEADQLIKLFDIAKYDWSYRSIGLFPNKPEPEEEDE